jgi:hypothetical protein
MMGLLRRSNLKIHKVPCGEPQFDRITTLLLKGASTPKVSANESGPSTDTPVVKIAMLSMKSQN